MKRRFSRSSEDGGPDELPLVGDDGEMAGLEACPGGGDVVAGEEEDVGCQVERRVEEGIEAEQAAEADEVRELGCRRRRGVMASDARRMKSAQ